MPRDPEATKRRPFVAAAVGPARHPRPQIAANKALIYSYSGDTEDHFDAVFPVGRCRTIMSLLTEGDKQ